MHGPRDQSAEISGPALERGPTHRLAAAVLGGHRARWRASFIGEAMLVAVVRQIQCRGSMATVMRTLQTFAGLVAQRPTSAGE